jgi:hypothetical protein
MAKKIKHKVSRKDRKARLVQHLKQVKQIALKKQEKPAPSHYNLFNDVYGRLTAGCKVKMQPIYESVFCKE